MAIEAIFDIAVSAVSSARFATVLLRFYQERRRGKITIKKGNREIIVEGVRVQDAERILNGPVQELVADL